MGENADVRAECGRRVGKNGHGNMRSRTGNAYFFVRWEILLSISDITGADKTKNMTDNKKKNKPGSISEHNKPKDMPGNTTKNTKSTKVYTELDRNRQWFEQQCAYPNNQ